MIEIKNLHKSFGEKNVLGGVNLKIETGEAFCIIGKSGCGKSVLLKCVVGLLTPDKGSVEIDGKNVQKMSDEEMRKLRDRIGFVFQGSALFDSYTVYRNVVLGIHERGERDERKLELEAIKVLTSVGLLPDKEKVSEEEFQREWNILKNKMPADLSGGMKKRVGVARALAGAPEYVFYDEPTTGLDPVTSQQIDNLIAELTQKGSATSIIITHDMFSVFKIANKVALLEDGVVKFEGDSEDLFKANAPAVVEFLERYKESV